MTLPVRFPVTLPVTLPVRFPVTLPVTLPVRLAVIVPVVVIDIVLLSLEIAIFVPAKMLRKLSLFPVPASGTTLANTGLPLPRLVPPTMVSVSNSAKLLLTLVKAVRRSSPVPSLA